MQTAFPAYFHDMSNISFCILCLSSEALRQQLFLILKVYVLTAIASAFAFHCVCVCVLFRARRSITLTGACVDDLWTAQSSATCWRRASTQAAPPVWVTRTPTIQTSRQRKRSPQPARACLTLSLCVLVGNIQLWHPLKSFIDCFCKVDPV